VSSIFEYNKQKLSFFYIFNADSESGFSFSVEKIFENLYDDKVKKYFYIFCVKNWFFKLFMKQVSVVGYSLNNADFKYV